MYLSTLIHQITDAPALILHVRQSTRRLGGRPSGIADCSPSRRHNRSDRASAKSHRHRSRQCNLVTTSGLRVVQRFVSRANDCCHIFVLFRRPCSRTGTGRDTTELTARMFNGKVADRRTDFLPNRRSAFWAGVRQNYHEFFAAVPGGAICRSADVLADALGDSG